MCKLQKTILVACLLSVMTLPAVAATNLPDFIISPNFDPPRVTTEAGTNTTMQFVINNVGDGPKATYPSSSPDMYVDLYIERSGEDDQLLQQGMIRPMAAQTDEGSATSRFISFSFFAPQEPGAYLLYTVVDATDMYDETDERNHSEYVILEVVERYVDEEASPDLIVTSLNVIKDSMRPAEVEIGNEVEILFEVQNIGDRNTQWHEDFLGEFECALYEFYDDPVLGLVQRRRIDLTFSPDQNFVDVERFALSVQDPCPPCCEFDRLSDCYDCDPLLCDCDPNATCTPEDSEGRTPFAIWFYNEFKSLYPDYVGALNAYEGGDVPLSRSVELALSSLINDLIQRGYTGFNLVDNSDDPQAEFSNDFLRLYNRLAFQGNPPGEVLAHLNRSYLEEIFTSELSPAGHLFDSIGAGAVLNYHWVIGAPTTPGTYYYQLKVDAADRIPERKKNGESNNWSPKIKVEVVGSMGDLHVPSISYAESTTNSVSLFVDVENLGFAPIDGTASLYLMPDVDKSLTDVLTPVDIQTVPVISPDQWVPLSMSFSFQDLDPEATNYFEPGTEMYLGVMVESDDPESDESNNWSELLLLTFPDLVVSETRFLDKDVASRYIRLGVQVRNIARQANSPGLSFSDVDSRFDVNVYYEDPNTAERTLVGSKRIHEPLLAEQGKSLTFVFDNFEGAEEGHFVAVVDDNGEVAEGNERNNEGQRVTLQFPDFEIQDTMVSENDAESGRATVQVTLNNASNASWEKDEVNRPSEELNVEVYVLYGPGYDFSNDTPASTQEITAIEANEQRELSFSFIVPSSKTIGGEEVSPTHVVAVVDNDGLIEEINEDNNRGDTVSIELGDLRFVGANLAAIYDESVEVDVSFDNPQEVAINRSFNLGLYFISDSDDDPLRQGQLIHLEPVDSLGALQTAAYTFDIPRPGPDAEESLLVLVLDPNNFIGETDETNNQSDVLAAGDRDMSILTAEFKADSDRNKPYDSCRIAGMLDDATAEELESANYFMTVRLSSPSIQEPFEETVALVPTEEENTGGTTTETSTSHFSAISANRYWGMFSGLIGLRNGSIGLSEESNESDFDSAMAKYQEVMKRNFTHIYPSLEYDQRETAATDGRDVVFLGLSLDTSIRDKNTTGGFIIDIQEVDLSGLAPPVLFELIFGQVEDDSDDSSSSTSDSDDDETLYHGIVRLKETQVNNGQGLPLSYLIGNTNAIKVNRAFVSTNGQLMVVTGGIAARDNSPDLPNQELTILWGSQQFTLPSESFQRIGLSHQYVAYWTELVEGGNGIVIINYDNATYTLIVVGSDVTIDPPTTGMTFGITYDDFYATTTIE